LLQSGFTDTDMNKFKSMYADDDIFPRYQQKPLGSIGWCKRHIKPMAWCWICYIS